jgi:hypothetical protein
MRIDTFITHNRIDRSRSHTSIALSFDSDDSKQVAKDLKIERKIYEALINENDQSCYSIELEFEIFHNSEQYKNLFEY